LPAIERYFSTIRLSSDPTGNRAGKGLEIGGRSAKCKRERTHRFNWNWQFQYCASFLGARLDHRAGRKGMNQFNYTPVSNRLVRLCGFVCGTSRVSNLTAYS